MHDGAEEQLHPRLRDGERGAEEDGKTLQVVATKIGNSKRFSREDRSKAMITSIKFSQDFNYENVIKLLNVNEGLCMCAEHTGNLGRKFDPSMPNHDLQAAQSSTIDSIKMLM